MQILGKGQYVGKVLLEVRDDHISVNVTNYSAASYNDCCHYHVNAHVSFVLKGGCLEKKDHTYERVAGKATVYRAGEPHQVLTMKNSAHVNLELDESFFKKYDLSEETWVRAVDTTPDLNLMMLQIYRELSKDDPLSATCVNMLILQRLHISSDKKYNRRAPNWLIKVQNLLHDRWNEIVTLEDLAIAADVHPVTISHYFPHHFYCTLSTYMRKLKIDRALTMIKHSKESLTDIGLECGFSDQSHFIRTFKLFTGFLPSQYRKL
jgi:AraC family transcriptional regulator